MGVIPRTFVEDIAEVGGRDSLSVYVFICSSDREQLYLLRASEFSCDSTPDLGSILEGIALWTWIFLEGRGFPRCVTGSFYTLSFMRLRASIGSWCYTARRKHLPHAHWYDVRAMLQQFALPVSQILCTPKLRAESSGRAH